MTKGNKFNDVLLNLLLATNALF